MISNHTYSKRSVILLTISRDNVFLPDLYGIKYPIKQSQILFQIAINCSIVYRLRKRPPSNHQYLNERRRRTNLIIIAVTCIFFVSWLPFNIFSVVTALKPNTFLKFASTADQESKTIDGGEIENNGTGQLVYGFLHILGAANACTNPILYGLLNENF